MAHVIACKVCGRELGTVSAPSKDELRKAASGSPYAGMVGMIPADFLTTFADWLTFECWKGRHLGGEHGSKEADDPLDKEADDRKEREAEHARNFGAG